MYLKTGDIIKSTASRNPFLYHRGIVLVEDGQTLICHNTPMHKNEFGGNVVCEPLNEFLADGRKILEVQPSCLEAEEIAMVTEAVRHIPFHAFTFNCEHYVHLAFECKKKSPQLQGWLIAAGVAAIILL